jgi:hypothetical protein
MGEAPIPGGIYLLQPPADGPRFEEWVVVKVESSGKTHNFIVQASNDGIHQRYALLDPVGMITLMAGTFDGHTVTSIGPISDAVPSALPLAAIQFLRWPNDSLRAGLPARLRLDCDGKAERRLSRDGELLISAAMGEPTIIRREDPAMIIQIRKANGQ